MFENVDRDHIEEFYNGDILKYYPNRRLVQGMFEILLISDLRFHILNTHWCTVDINTAIGNKTRLLTSLVNKDSISDQNNLIY